MASGDKVEQIRLIDPDTGEIELDLTRIKRKDKLGRDWIAMYQKPIKQIIEEMPTFGTMKIWLYLASSIDYEGKFEASKAYVAREVKLTYCEAHKCLKWLEENHYIQMIPNKKGNYDYYVNPDLIMKGNKREKAVSRWVKNSGAEVKMKNGKMVYTFNHKDK